MCKQTNYVTTNRSDLTSIADRKDLPLRGLENEWKYRARNIRHHLAYIPTYHLRPIVLDPVL